VFLVGACGVATRATGPRAGAAPASERAAVARARASGQRVEVLSKRSETMEVFAEPNGTFTALLHAGPVRVRRGGGWVPVDTTLERRADGSVGPRATVEPLAFSGGGSGPLLRLGRDGRRVTLTWPWRLPAPRLAGDTATYPEVLPGVDLRLTAAATGFHEVLVVKTRQAAANPALARLRFGISTSGLSPRSGRDGGSVLVTPRAVRRSARRRRRCGTRRRGSTRRSAGSSCPATRSASCRTGGCWPTPPRCSRCRSTRTGTHPSPAGPRCSKKDPLLEGAYAVIDEVVPVAGDMKDCKEDSASCAWLATDLPTPLLLLRFLKPLFKRAKEEVKVVKEPLKSDPVFDRQMGERLGGVPPEKWVAGTGQPRSLAEEYWRMQMGKDDHLGPTAAAPKLPSTGCG
jgi:hypothetical protein